jgi:ELWxxDGT repeat protein
MKGRSLLNVVVIVLALASVVGQGIAAPPEPYRVMNINPTGSSSPEELTDVNGTLYFAASDGTHGDELWQSDGTEAGTTMVLDINDTDGSSPEYLTNVNGTLFFAADDGERGEELWMSTRYGTEIVKDIWEGPSTSYLSELVNVDGTLFFCANEGSAGEELWRSDGTDSGTQRVKDINPGPDESCWRGSSYFTAVNDTLFFAADNGSDGWELWKSDGTPGGTVMVENINGSGDSDPEFLAAVGGTLFFSANDGSKGWELWKSDGTPEGTLMVKDIWTGPNSSAPGSLTAVNGTLFFTANDGTNGQELWKSDGTPAGTVMVKNIHDDGDSDPEWLVDVNGTLFFAANDGSLGHELWKSDGTPGGTVMVKDIDEGSPNSDPQNLVNMDGTLVFIASDATHGYELWRSDGTPEGTALVDEINPSGNAFFGLGDTPIAGVDAVVYFAANDGTPDTELWALVVPSGPRQFVVDSFTDDQWADDAFPGNGVCADAYRACTLRTAIMEANAWPGRDTITFAWPMTITLDANRPPLPFVNEPVIVDASSVWDTGAGRPGVTLEGGGIGASGLSLSAGLCDIYGLTITGFGVAGIMVASQGNHIGGDGPGQGNVLVGNTEPYAGCGLLIIGAGATSNVVQGNTIGLAPSGEVLANKAGVCLQEGAADNTVLDNVIAGNIESGVRVISDTTTGNTITANSIYSNGLGIDLVDGGNGGLAAPAIEGAIPGQAWGTACASCRVEVFSDAGDQGRTYHGFTTADPGGNWVYDGSLDGPYVTATATDADGNTSGFSAPEPLVEPETKKEVFLPLILRNR